MVTIKTVTRGGLIYHLFFDDGGTLLHVSKGMRKAKQETDKMNKSSSNAYRTWLPLMFAGQRLQKTLGGIGGEMQSLYSATILEAAGMSLMSSYWDSWVGFLEMEALDAIYGVVDSMSELDKQVIASAVRIGGFAGGLLETSANAALVFTALGGKEGIAKGLGMIASAFDNPYVKAMAGAAGLGLAIYGTLNFIGPEGEINWSSVATAVGGAAMLGFMIGGPTGAAIAAVLQTGILVTIKLLYDLDIGGWMAAREEAARVAVEQAAWITGPGSQFGIPMTGIPIHGTPYGGSFSEITTPEGAGENGFSGGNITINVSASVSNDYDIKRLAEQLGAEMYNLKRAYGGGLGGR